MFKNPAKVSIKPQLAGLTVGTGLAALIQLALVPPAAPVMPFYEFVITVYFLAGLFSGCLSPKLSWQWGIWQTLPWIVWIFFNIAGAGFKDGIMGSLSWLVFYSFPVLPACAGVFAGAIIARWKIL
jgi:hypothetical protein